MCLCLDAFRDYLQMQILRHTDGVIYHNLALLRSDLTITNKLRSFVSFQKHDSRTGDINYVPMRHPAFYLNCWIGRVPRLAARYLLQCRLTEWSWITGIIDRNLCASWTIIKYPLCVNNL